MATLNAKRMLHKVRIQSTIIAILKLGKDSAISKSYIPICFLCHMYKLYKRLILNTIALSVKRHLIKEQSASNPGSHAAVSS